MSQQIQRRWGILATAVLMFLVTIISNSLSGTKGSLYLLVWIFVGFNAYQGRLKSIETLMKWLIVINLVVILAVLFIYDDEVVGYISSEGKWGLVVGVLVMLIPKIGLYFYVRSQQKRSTTQVENRATSAVSQNNKISVTNSYPNSYSADVQRTLNTLKAAKEKLEMENERTQRDGNHKLEKQVINDEVLWAKAYEEFDGELLNKGLWARCFSEVDGDENKAKASYLKERVRELRDNKLSELAESLEASKSTNQYQISNKLFQKIKVRDANCFLLNNGNYAIEFENNYAVYDSFNSLNKAITLFEVNYSWSKYGLIEILEKDKFEFFSKN